MKLKVEDDNLTIIEEDIIRAKTINEYEIELEFSEEWNDLSKIIVYTNGTDVWQETIIDNKSIIPSLPNYRDYAIGVVGTIIENDVIVKRKATNLIYHAITVSSAEYEQNQLNEEVLAKTYEKYLQLITAESIKISGYLGDIQKLVDNITTKANEIKDDVNTIESYKEEVETNKQIVENLVNQAKEDNKDFKSELSDYTESLKGNLNDYELIKERELTEHADTKKDELDKYTTNQELQLKNNLDKHTEEKTKELDNHNKTLVDDLNSHAETKLNEYNDNTISKLDEYNKNAESKIKEYNENADELVAMNGYIMNRLIALNGEEV